MNGKIKYCPMCRTLLKKKEVEEHLRLVCPKCGWVNYENPIPSVAILLKNPNNEILLIKRNVEPEKEKWALPSGFIEAEETTEDATIRELKEETNLRGKIKRLLGVYIEHPKIYKSILVIGYEVEFISGSLLAGSDCSKAKFFPLEELPPIPFSAHRSIINDGLK